MKRPGLKEKKQTKRIAISYSPIRSVPKSVRRGYSIAQPFDETKKGKNESDAFAQREGSIISNKTPRT